MIRRLRQLYALSGPDQRELLQAALTMIPVSLLLRFLAFHKVQALLERTSPQRAGEPKAGDLDAARRLANLVGIAARHGPVKGACLQRSLTLWWMLRRRGLPAHLRIGVRKKDGFEAHAWVELRGRPVNDGEGIARRFSPFPIEACSAKARR